MNSLTAKLTLINEQDGLSVCLFPQITMVLCWLTWYCQAFSTCIILLIIATIIGVAVGVPLSKKRHNDNNIAVGNSTGNNGNSNSSETLPPANNGADPSVFPKNPNFHQSFYGIAYTPDGSQLPNCGNNLGQPICIEWLCFKWLESWQRLSLETSRWVEILFLTQKCLGTHYKHSCCHSWPRCGPCSNWC